MKNFTAAILLAIGAYAGDYANQPHPSHQPYTGGDLHSKDTFLYGRFVAMMKSSQAKGTHT
jgi:beta-glucanase (GH16 family)